MRKISREFLARLSGASSRQSFRVVVLLRDPGSGAQAGNQRSNGQFLVRKRGEQEANIAKLDEALARSGGRRLTNAPNALGYVTVEATRKGIEALADSDFVRTIMEDQAVHSLATTQTL